MAEGEVSLEILRNRSQGKLAKGKATQNLERVGNASPFETSTPLILKMIDPRKSFETGTQASPPANQAEQYCYVFAEDPRGKQDVAVSHAAAKQDVAERSNVAKIPAQKDGISLPEWRSMLSNWQPVQINDPLLQMRVTGKLDDSGIKHATPFIKRMSPNLGSRVTWTGRFSEEVLKAVPDSTFEFARKMGISIESYAELKWNLGDSGDPQWRQDYASKFGALYPALIECSKKQTKVRSRSICYERILRRWACTFLEICRSRSR
jgi:hypothetical protein